jgi:hypothetical protein
MVIEAELKVDGTMWEVEQGFSKLTDSYLDVLLVSIV